jgi:signal transduction histidine kinase
LSKLEGEFIKIIFLCSNGMGKSIFMHKNLINETEDSSLQMRLSLVAKQIGIGTSTIVQKLAINGHRVENNPNAKLNAEQLKIVAKEFGAGYLIRSYNVQENSELQNESLQKYEDLRTHYALHNIKNATKNMDWTLKSLDIQNFTSQDLEDLNNNIKRIYDTLDDFNKLNNIREQKEFKVRELADIFNKLIRPSVKTKEIKFSFIYQNEDYGDFNVEQNFYDVFQIFNNLIINAEKAMETVSTKELNILVGDFDGTNLCFYVRDTGIGISKESRKKVFKESFSTTGGTGIGLMYIRDELKKMEGEITLLESNEQFSTIFEVKIPINLQ